MLPDLNNDGLSDLAVGAPLENDGQGSIYIFHGEGGRTISSAYSQVSKMKEANKKMYAVMFATLFYRKAILFSI